MANTRQNQITVIVNSLILDSPNIVVSSSQTSAPQVKEGQGNVISQKLGQYPLLLRSLNLSWDTNFASAYSYCVQLQGLNINNNKFIAVSSGSGGKEYVPTGTAYLIPANATLDIYAYNSGSGSNNGIVTLYSVFEIVSVEEYNALLSNTGGS